MFYIHKTPGWIKGLYPSLTWNLPTQEKVIYLTFDDGPIPEVTPEVVEILKKYEAKATFFCVGDNIRKHPKVFEMVVKAGHNVANHTYHHIKGWQNTLDVYLEDIEECQQIIHSFNIENRLFRPPYGRITSKQIREVKQKFKIVMWDVLTGDYNASLSADSILKRIIKATKPGSIVVFHDSIKAYPRLASVLPDYLSYFQDQGFRFEAIKNTQD